MAAPTEIQVAYETDDPHVHTMDVEQLAPSLLAIGALCKRANAIVNGDKATVRVLVESDFEHKCFLIHLQVVLDIYHQLQALLHHQEVKTAKEILEWLGLIGLPPAAGAVGLITYLRKKRGRRPLEIKTVDKDGTVEVRFEGDNNVVTVNNNVYQMSRDSVVINSVKNILLPTQTSDINEVQFRDRGETIESVNKMEAAEIIANEGADGEMLSPGNVPPQVVDARLTIHSPTFDPHSKTWKFIYGGNVIAADISGSGVAEDVMRRGAISIGDAYLVKLEITERQTQSGRFKNHYRVLGFSEFIPAPAQISLLSDPDDKEA